MKDEITRIINLALNKKLQEKYDYVKLPEAEEPTKVGRTMPSQHRANAPTVIRNPEKAARDELEKQISQLPSRVPDKKVYQDPAEPNPHRMALKANTIWTNNLAQLMSFEKGKQLATLMAKRLEDQTGMPAQQMMPIISAVIKATLEQLDDEVTAEMSKKFPGIFDNSRS